jgi:hypothetical protein
MLTVAEAAAQLRVPARSRGKTGRSAGFMLVLTDGRLQGVSRPVAS